MSKRTKIWLIIGASFVILGSIIFAAVMTAYKWDFTKLSTVNFETNTYEINEDFNNITLETNTADILFLPSDNGECKVVCSEKESDKHTVFVQDDTLTVNVNSEKEWYDYINITAGTPTLTLHLPKNEYDKLFIEENTGDIELPIDFTFESIDISASTGDITSFASAYGNIKITTSTGDINTENISANALDLSVSTGDINVSSVSCENEIKVNVGTGRAKLSGVTCSNLISNGDTGDITLKNVIATENFSIERDTGYVIFDSCDAGNLSIKTDTGDVKGSLLSDKVFIVETDTGNVDVPKTVTGGRCEIFTDTGDIKIQIK